MKLLTMKNVVDASLRSKNKAPAKKLRNQSSNVSSRVAANIAAKKRRKLGKRRKCEGMCFSLPTIDDPFNDRHGKINTKNEKRGKHLQIEVFNKEHSNERRTPIKKRNVVRQRSAVIYEHEEGKIDVLAEANKLKLSTTKQNMKGENCVNNRYLINESDRPSKFLIMCLSCIENALRHDGIYSIGDEKPLFASLWGIEFLKHYSSRQDILETSMSGCTVEKIAWIASVTADSMAKKEKEGILFDNPFLLFLVPSREKAMKIRHVCKALKSIGIHTVSLHSGASLDHQIHGLKSCEPEFVVSTPDRLMELVSLHAIDVSSVCAVVVVDGVSGNEGETYIEAVRAVYESISAGQQHFTIFSNCLENTSVKILLSLLRGSVCHLPRDEASLDCLPE